MVVENSRLRKKSRGRRHSRETSLQVIVCEELAATSLVAGPDIDSPRI